MRMALLLLGSIGIAVIGGCASTVKRNEDVRAVAERFVRSVNAADAREFTSFFADDATAFFPSSASAGRRTGIMAIRTAIEPVFAEGPRSVPAYLGDLVVTQIGEFAVVSFDAASGPTHSRRTLVMRKIAGEWKIIHLHASNVGEAGKQ